MSARWAAATASHPTSTALAGEGLLFERFFANGTHTHRGMFASMACFPNLPGFEYLMQSPEGGNRFSGLPQLLSARAFNDIYVYNGDFARDNRAGFFGNGARPVLSGATTTSTRWWPTRPGRLRPDMFDRAVQELGALALDKPFYALPQTLSNHTPYALPDPLPVPAVTGHGSQDAHLTAMRYSDWALGRFFEQAKRQPGYKDTLFVVVGDHGFGAPEQLTEMDLFRFHVPLLLIAPGVTEQFGSRREVVGTGRRGADHHGPPRGEVRHQCWGRDLLALDERDPGFGIIKPSGSDQTVAMIRGEQIRYSPRTSSRACTGIASVPMPAPSGSRMPTTRRRCCASCRPICRLPPAACWPTPRAIVSERRRQPEKRWRALPPTVNHRLRRRASAAPRGLRAAPSARPRGQAAPAKRRAASGVRGWRVRCCLSGEPAAPRLPCGGCGELVEQRAALDAMGVGELGDVLRRGLRIAGDVEDALEATGQFAGVRVHAGAWRVDEDAAEVVALQVDPGQAAERAHLVQCLRQLLGGEPHQLDVVDAVVFDVGQRGVDRGLADLGGQHAAHAGGQRQGEVAVAAVQLQQVVIAFAERFEGPVQHLLADLAVGLGEGAFRLAVAEAAAGDHQLFFHVIAADDDALALERPTGLTPRSAASCSASACQASSNGRW